MTGRQVCICRGLLGRKCILFLVPLSGHGDRTQAGRKARDVECKGDARRGRGVATSKDARSWPTQHRRRPGRCGVILQSTQTQFISAGRVAEAEAGKQPADDRQPAREGFNRREKEGPQVPNRSAKARRRRVGWGAPSTQQRHQGMCREVLWTCPKSGKISVRLEWPASSQRYSTPPISRRSSPIQLDSVRRSHRSSMLRRKTNPQSMRSHRVRSMADLISGQRP